MGGKYSIIASVVDFWNKIPKKLKNTAERSIYPPITRQFSAIFILNII